MGERGLGSVQCSVFSVQCSVFSVQCSVFGVRGRGGKTVHEFGHNKRALANTRTGSANCANWGEWTPIRGNAFLRLEAPFFFRSRANFSLPGPCARQCPFPATR